MLFWLVGSGYLRAILHNDALFKNTIADYSTGIGPMVVLSFVFINYLSYLMLLALIPALIMWVVAVSFSKYKKLIWLGSVLLASFSLALLAVDSYVYSLFKFHLNPTIFSFLFSTQSQALFDISNTEIVWLSVAFVMLLLVESLLAVFVWRKIIVAKKYYVGTTLALLWFGGVLFSYFTLMISMASLNHNLFSQQTSALPLFNQLLSRVIPSPHAAGMVEHYTEHHFSQPLFSTHALHYPQHTLRCQPTKPPYNIVLIMVDALRFDSVKPPYMPYLFHYAQQQWQFMQHMSGGNATQSGLFSLFYSLPSSYWTAALQQQKAPVWMDVLRQFGYVIKVFWSNEMHTPPFHKTIYLHVKPLALQGAPGQDISQWDKYTTEQAVAFIKTHNKKTPFFLNLFYNAAHAHCRKQRFPQPFQPVLQHCQRLSLGNAIDPVPYYHRYLNAVHFIDEQIGQVLQALDKAHLEDNTIIIITADHGEEFNDNQQNYWGHTGNFTRYQVQVPLIIHWPKQSPARFNYLTSAYDIVPTLLQDVFGCSNPLKDYSIGQHLLKPTPRLPFLLVGSYINMGIIEADRLTTLEASGRIRITDKHALPLNDATPRVESIRQALAWMRYYYKNRF